MPTLTCISFPFIYLLLIAIRHSDGSICEFKSLLGIAHWLISNTAIRRRPTRKSSHPFKRQPQQLCEPFRHKMHRILRRSEKRRQSRKCFFGYHKVITHSVPNQLKFNLKGSVVVASPAPNLICTFPLIVRASRWSDGARIFHANNFYYYICHI